MSERPLRRTLVKLACELFLGRRRRHAQQWLPHLAFGVAETDGTRPILYRNRRVGTLRPAAILKSQSGEEIYIVGSGPSVKDTRVEVLPERSAILLNGAVTLCNDAIADPLAVAVEDERFIWKRFDLLKRKLAPGTILLLSVSVIRAICEIDPAFLHNRSIILIDDLRKPYGAERCDLRALAPLPFVVVDEKRDAGISLDPDRGVFQGGSVAISALQFAMFCRPRSIGLIGIDIANADQPRFYEMDGNVASSGVVRGAPRIIAHFVLAQQVAGTQGIAIVNHSPLSALISAGFPYDDNFARGVATG
ncbi:glycosyl transferase [Rhizobium sp. ARZ01]|nr:glycosyl transferase [Rhizobium sp. ARZ01]